MGTEGFVLYDSSLMKDYQDRGWHGIPFYKLAQEAGSVKTANIVAIGAMMEKVPVVSLDSFAKVIAGRFSPAVAELNMQAVKCGMAAARSL